MIPFGNPVKVGELRGNPVFCIGFAESDNSLLFSKPNSSKTYSLEAIQSTKNIQLDPDAIAQAERYRNAAKIKLHHAREFEKLAATIKPDITAREVAASALWIERALKNTIENLGKEHDDLNKRVTKLESAIEQLQRSVNKQNELLQRWIDEKASELRPR